MRNLVVWMAFRLVQGGRDDSVPKQEMCKVKEKRQNYLHNKNRFPTFAHLYARLRTVFRIFSNVSHVNPKPMKRHFSLLLTFVFCLLASVQAAEPDFFTVKNTHASQKLTVMLKRGSYAPANVTLNYRVIDASNNVGEWQTLTTVNTTTNYTLGDIPAGSRMQFYGNNSTKGFSQGSMTYWTMYFDGSGTAVLSGELMSVFSGTETSIDLTKTLPSYAFYYFFYNVNAKNTRIVSTKDLKLSATNLGQYCYGYMFAYCSNMTDAPQLLATTLASNCYYGMFSYCSSLTDAPQLPATTLASNCYNYMFSYCTSLTTAPQLPVTTLAESCYQSMFIGCTSLVNVQPELPSNDLPKQCYYEMFSGCTALTTAPEIMAGEDAVVGQGACYNMFTNCSTLTKAPSVLRPRTLTVNQVYYNMFLNCTSLQRGPDVWATTIGSGKTALFGLYQKAEKLTHIRVHFKAWGSMSFCNQWSVGLPTKGAFYCPPELERNFTNSSWNHIPYSPDYPWTVFSYNLTYIPVEGEWPDGQTDHRQYTWQTDTNYVQGWMRELDAAGASYWHDQACTESFPEEEIIAFLATQKESSSDITKNIYVKLGAVAKVTITFVDDDYHNNQTLASVPVLQGAMPVYPNGEPAAYSIGDKIYYFVGWTPALVPATENATYKAVYSDSPRYEYVGFKLEDEDKNEFECTPVTKPVVLTNDATSVTADGAVLNGQVTSDGGLTVTERGLCWGTAADALTNCTTSGEGTGAFTYTLTDLTPSTPYYFQAYATNSIGTAQGEVRSFTTEASADPSGFTCNHEWVQLWEGGPKWATMNLGASSPEDPGDYYMWGGTTANPAYCSWSYCPYQGSDQNNSPYTKYGVAADGRITLEKEDDAAAQTWCNGWRIPTRDEVLELLNKCTVTYNYSKRGYTFTSKENPALSIFMPTAGYKKDGTEWYKDGSKYARYLTATSTASTDSDRDCYILYWYVKNVYTEDHKPEANTLSIRYWGMSVRPVCD